MKTMKEINDLIIDKYMEESHKKSSNLLKSNEIMEDLTEKVAKFIKEYKYESETETEEKVIKSHFNYK